MRSQRRVADEVDATMHDAKASSTDAVGDRLGRGTEGEQLSARDDPVLNISHGQDATQRELCS